MVSATVPQTNEEIVHHLLDVLEASEKMPYIGELVSQKEHALQAAYFAQKDQMPEEVVIAALLHDIGHICMPEGTPVMVRSDGVSVGIKDHEYEGAEYLRKFGFSDLVCSLVAGHVEAKRYLTWKSKEYLEGLSDASKETLKWQGGPFNDEEARAFEAEPTFKYKVSMRQYDEASKVFPHPSYMPTLESFRSILLAHLSRKQTA
eukprot:Colp12_sorted_trinity150504_noHs@17984